MIVDNETSELFWLFVVDKIVQYVVHESFEDMWINSYVKKDVILRGC
jgi:hypothetical protein